MTNDNTRSEIRRLKDEIAELKQAVWDINERLKAIAAVTGGAGLLVLSDKSPRQKLYTSCEHSDCSHSR
jgi:hypothetical protein